jgi:hypothetical protein
MWCSVSRTVGKLYTAVCVNCAGVSAAHAWSTR